MKIGYARVSTCEQNLELQEDALKKCECVKIFTDKISGRVESREGLNEALCFAREGDSLVVFSLSRLGRSLKHLIEIAGELERRNISLISLTEQIDTSSASGKLLFHLLASLSQFEADLIRQRTYAGLESARLRGRIGGRPRAIQGSDTKRLLELSKKELVSKKEIAQMLGVSRATVYRYFKLSKDYV